MTIAEPIRSSELGAMEKVWSYAHRPEIGEFIICGGVEVVVKRSIEKLDYAFFENVLKAVAMQNYRLCCRLQSVTHLELAVDKIGELPIRLTLMEMPSFGKEDVDDIIRRELNTPLSTLADEESPLLWRCNIIKDGGHMAIVVTFAHLLTDGAGAMSVLKCTINEIVNAINGCPAVDFDAPILARPPPMFEENVVPEMCSFVPALVSMIQTQNFDPRPDRFNGTPVDKQANMLNQSTTTLLSSFNLSVEETSAFLMCCKANKASVTSALIACGMSASRTVFELTKGVLEPIQDKQGFFLPFDARFMVVKDIDPDNCVSNYVATSMHPDYTFRDRDQFWTHAADIRDYYRADSIHLKGRVSLFKKAFDEGQVIAQTDKWIAEGANRARAVSICMSSLGVVPPCMGLRGVDDCVDLLDVWGSLSAWHISAAFQFHICCGTINDHLKIVVTGPNGPISMHQFNTYVETLKQVISRVSKHQFISVGEARR